MLFCGRLTIPYLGLIYHCYFYAKKLNYSVSSASHRAAILFKKTYSHMWITVRRSASQLLSAQTCMETDRQYRRCKIKCDHLQHYRDGKSKQPESVPLFGISPDCAKRPSGGYGL